MLAKAQNAPYVELTNASYRAQKEWREVYRSLWGYDYAANEEIRRLCDTMQWDLRALFK